MMPITVMCPSRNRPECLMKMVESVVATSNHAEVLARIDDDQIDLYAGCVHERLSIISGPRLGMCGGLRDLSHEGDHRLMGFIPDDCLITSPGWDEKMLAWFDTVDNDIGAYWPTVSTGGWDLPFVSEKWVRALKWYVPPGFIHYAWLEAILLLGYATRYRFADLHDFGIYNDAKFPSMAPERTDDNTNLVMWLGDFVHCLERLRSVAWGAERPANAWRMG